MFEEYTAVQSGSRNWKIDYPFRQIADELLRLGKAEETGGGGVRYKQKDYDSVKRRFKANAVDPQGHATFADILCYTRTPWGYPQRVTALPDEAKGLYFCSTAWHGGLWLSNAWIKKLPKDYCEYIDNRRWAEEDCDCADVLQIFGFLSLVSEPTELHITQADIEKGKETRVDYRDRPMTDKYFEEGWAGGPIAEAFKRQTGCPYDMINTERVLQAAPGIWKYCSMPENGTALNKAFDAGEAVEPTTLLLEPYDYVPYRKRLKEKVTLIETRHTTEDQSESAESGELFTLPTWREKLDAEDVISALEASEKKLPFQLSELPFTEETAEHFLTEARSSYNEGDLPYTYSIYSKGIYAYELGYQTQRGGNA